LATRPEIPENIDNITHHNIKNVEPGEPNSNVDDVVQIDSNYNNYRINSKINDYNNKDFNNERFEEVFWPQFLE